ncbi:MAG: hypothetical protein AB7T31_16710 [Gemmatimonadales bacterium]
MRTPTHTFALTLLIALALAAALGPSPLAAQADGGPPLFLAMPDVYPDVDGRVTLLREQSREVIVLARDATPEDLGVAIRMLARFRRERGQPERGRGNMIPIVGHAGTTLNAERRTRLETVLRELRSRPVTQVGNLGRGRWMRLDQR